jgi:hypothetical protein
LLPSTLKQTKELRISNEMYFPSKASIRSSLLAFSADSKLVEIKITNTVKSFFIALSQDLLCG